MQHDTEQTVMLIRTVPGMNCQGCVKRMREAIQAQDPAAQVDGFPAENSLNRRAPTRMHPNCAC